jgi:hypothetical protein
VLHAGLQRRDQVVERDVIRGVRVRRLEHGRRVRPEHRAIGGGGGRVDGDGGGDIANRLQCIGGEGSFEQRLPRHAALGCNAHTSTTACASADLPRCACIPRATS